MKPTTFLAPDEPYYSTTGEWALVDDNTTTVGVTDFRVQQLGEVLYIDFPDEGKLVKQGEIIFSIESINAIHDFAAPVSGTILEINHGLLSDPGALNDDPFHTGWLLVIEMDQERDLANLIRGPDYRKHLANA